MRHGGGTSGKSVASEQGYEREGTNWESTEKKTEMNACGKTSGAEETDFPSKKRERGRSRRRRPGAARGHREAQQRRAAKSVETMTEGKTGKKKKFRRRRRRGRIKKSLRATGVSQRQYGPRARRTGEDRDERRKGTQKDENGHTHTHTHTNNDTQKQQTLKKGAGDAWKEYDWAERGREGKK